MIANALLLALVLFMAFCFLLMHGLKFLIPYRQPIFHNYGWANRFVCGEGRSVYALRGRG